MKVGELIEELKKQDPDTRVEFFDKTRSYEVNGIENGAAVLWNGHSWEITNVVRILTGDSWQEKVAYSIKVR